MLILNSDYDAARASAALDLGVVDAIAFGRHFVANPDLPRRMAERLPMANDDMQSWFSQGADCYINYASLP